MQVRTGLMGGKQLGFGDYEQSTAKKRTKRERFLSGICSGVGTAHRELQSC